MESTTPLPPNPDQSVPQTEVSSSTPTPEQKPIIRSKDILEAPDVATALGTYQAARKERYGDKASTLMGAMGEKLLQLGQVEPALQWTLASEQTANAEKGGETQESLEQNVNRFGRETNNLDETVGKFGHAARSFDGSVNAMGYVANRISDAASRMGGR